MAYIEDGYQTLITFAEDGTVELKEQTVTPPGISAGGSVDTTTMRNTAWRTKAPKKLKELSDAGCSVLYDPVCYDSILAMVGVNQLITITFPDTSTLAFWGWLDSFTPGELQEGNIGTATCTIMCSNQNASSVETAPDYTAPSA